MMYGHLPNKNQPQSDSIIPLPLRYNFVLIPHWYKKAYNSDHRCFIDTHTHAP